MKEIIECRICGNKNLIPIINLGNMAMCGKFLKHKNDPVIRSPLDLVKCDESDGVSCGLVQLKHSNDPNMMYAIDYGYRSSLNTSMVAHLNDITNMIMGMIELKKDNIILDIGSNDGTLLKAYPQSEYILVGMDSCGDKFAEYYDVNEISFHPGFFSKSKFKQIFGSKAKVKIITSIAMFYDLESPLEFMQDIADILDNNGIWVTEQSYMPSMINNVDYTTICHEHLSYYRLKQIDYMAKLTGLKIIKILWNKINGGSFCVFLAKEKSKYSEDKNKVDVSIRMEESNRYNTMKPYSQFAVNAKGHRERLINLLIDIKTKNKLTIGYGASTKGNTLLQYCSIDEYLIPAIAEINQEKFDCYTPGSEIKIISEKQAHYRYPDYFLVLPWHFRESILVREKAFMKRGGKLIFPFPKIEYMEW